MRVSEPVLIVDLARLLLRHTATAEDTTLIQFTDLRPGEKLVEELLSADESLRPTSHAAIQATIAPRVSADAFDRTLLQLREIVQRRDVAELLETLCQLVPNYQPGSTLCPAGRLAHD